MDLIATLRSRIELLDAGEYIPGLKAVLLHIETAFRHLSRGRNSGDETAFTDAIYRANQAFEGGIKEAYRVLAEKDPKKMRPFDIESYLEENVIFRGRVLKQFTTYRVEWRNPSTHDYQLFFDESEAFLAIVTVSAFACLLLDEIIERLSFRKSQLEAESHKEAKAILQRESEGLAFLDRIVYLLRKFCSDQASYLGDTGEYTEVKVIGALHGFFYSVAPDLSCRTDVAYEVNGKGYRVDILISSGADMAVVEVKRFGLKRGANGSVLKVEQYMLVSGARNGVLIFIPSGNADLEEEEFQLGADGGRIVVLRPHPGA